MVVHLAPYYYGAFTVIDLVSSIMTLWLYFFEPDFVLRNQQWKTMQEADVTASNALAGWYAALGAFHLFLRYCRPADLALWKAHQSTVIIFEVFMFCNLLKMHQAQDIPSIFALLFHEEPRLLGFIALFLIRIAFCCGIGIRKGELAPVNTAKEEVDT